MYGNYGCMELLNLSMETMGVWKFEYGCMEFGYGYVHMGVWKSSFSLDSLDTWFRTLYLVYGLGLGTPKLISCRFGLRRALRLLDTCFEKGPVTSRNQKIPCFRSYVVVES